MIRDAPELDSGECWILHVLPRWIADIAHKL